MPTGPESQSSTEGQQSMATSRTSEPVAGAAGWELFPHDADIGVRGWGPTVERAFEEAALALTGVVTNAEIRSLCEVAVACEAPDLELLLVDWLNSVAYEMAARRMLFGRFKVSIADETRLHAVVSFGASRLTSPGTRRRSSRRAQPSPRLVSFTALTGAGLPTA